VTDGGSQHESNDLRLVAVFVMGISVGVCAMLLYMAYHDRTRHTVNPAPNVEAYP
jgi:hypothetical protein